MIDQANIDSAIKAFEEIEKHFEEIHKWMMKQEGYYAHHWMGVFSGYILGAASMGKMVLGKHEDKE